MINVKPCIPVVKESTPEAVKNILLHWHLVKGDKYIAWKDGKFGRYCRDEYGNTFFDSSAYSKEELREITTYLVEEENIIENEKKFAKIPVEELCKQGDKVC